MTLDRYHRMHAELLARGDSRPHEWRVSIDEWSSLEDLAAGPYGLTMKAGESQVDRLLGLPIIKDSRLPLRSIILEPVPSL